MRAPLAGSFNSYFFGKQNIANVLETNSYLRSLMSSTPLPSVSSRLFLLRRDIILPRILLDNVKELSLQEWIAVGIFNCRVLAAKGKDFVFQFESDGLLHCKLWIYYNDRNILRDGICRAIRISHF